MTETAPKIKYYGIARFFTRTALELASSVQYSMIDGLQRVRVLDEVCDPLGFALRVDRPDDVEFMPGSPCGDEVAEYLGIDEWDTSYAECVSAAEEFINDWDDEILRPEDLPAAFGLED